MSDFRKSTVYQICVKSFQDSDGQTLTVVTNFGGDAEPVAADLWARLQGEQVLVTNCGKGAKPGPDPVLQPWSAFAVLK